MTVDTLERVCFPNMPFVINGCGPIEDSLKGLLHAMNHPLTVTFHWLENVIGTILSLNLCDV